MRDDAMPDYYMFQRFADGSVAVRAGRSKPWTVIEGVGGKSQLRRRPSMAPDFAATQNRLIRPILPLLRPSGPVQRRAAE